MIPPLLLVKHGIKHPESSKISATAQFLSLPASWHGAETRRSFRTFCFCRIKILQVVITNEDSDRRKRAERLEKEYELGEFEIEEKILLPYGTQSDCKHQSLLTGRTDAYRILQVVKRNVGIICRKRSVYVDTDYKPGCFVVGEIIHLTSLTQPEIIYQSLGPARTDAKKEMRCPAGILTMKLVVEGVKCFQ